MKIKNNLIRIEIGNKKYDFHNLILNYYLEKITKAQLSKETATSSKVVDNLALNYILLKFEEPFTDLNENTELKYSDFDICLVNKARTSQDISKNKITVKYNYKEAINDFVIDIQETKSETATSESVIKQFKEFYRRKVTAIGFTSHWFYTNNQRDRLIETVLDTSNYNIYLNENQEFTVTRKDIFTTDAEFYTNNENKVKGPAHLSPLGLPQIIYQPDIHEIEKNDDGTESDSIYSFYDYGKGVLESVGLSQNPNYIEKEYEIGKDVQAINNGTEIEINGIINDEKEEGSIYPSSDLFPSESLYPEECNYKYIIFKYVIYQYVATGQLNSEGNPIQEIKDTGCYYYQAIPLKNFKKMKVKIKYERG